MLPRARRLALALPTACLALAGPAPAGAATWQDVTGETIGTTAEWSNKVELADVDGDGHLDILFANGGDYASAGTPEPLRVFAGDGAGGFTEITTDVFGAATFLSRAVKVRDLTGDGLVDVLVSTTYQTRSRLYVADGRGGFVDRTDDLPAAPRSIGDVELGDVDGDGDLDAVLADWGPGSPLSNDGGQPRLWLNDGAGRFTDATAERMPALAIGMSWELELLDVDNDRDLDALIACKVCDGSVLLRNDGAGGYADASDALPQFGNNYEFEAMDLDADGFLDVVTINDGPGLGEHVFRGDGTGFVDATADWWPDSANVGDDDNAVAFLDVDGDGDADFLIGSLSGSDRVLVNDGAGHLSAGSQGFASTQGRVGDDTPGTLGIAVADLNGDGKLDVVESQGEAADPEAVYFGVDLPVDAVAPSVREVAPPAAFAAGGALLIVARVHDHRSPVRSTDFETVELVVTEGGAERAVPMAWYGEYLFRAAIEPAGPVTVQVCATDARGNRGCSAAREIAATSGGGEDGGPDAPDAGGPGAEDDGGGGGCGCRAGGDGRGAAAGLALALALVAHLARLGRSRRRDGAA